MTNSASVPGDRRLHRRTTSDTVADELRSAILRGDFEDGMELNQVDLAREFGVSRVPIREALRQLKAEGLISSEPHMRAAVVGHTLERVIEILELRILLETYLLSRSATRMTKGDFAELRAMCDKMGRTRSHEDWLVLNTAFHDRLYDHADAPVARDLAHQLTMRVQRYTRMVRSGRNKRSGDPNAEHVAILDALERGDVSAARQELERHIQHTAARVKQIFVDRGEQAKATTA
ncbi:GntR family transcriptional regulator [Rugosimonospora acidiphila]|uniref:GntR family transcriptional regulator n=1 Tax=Rugosimonospora acidiphila TaxID=556531 RepID=A0ABP9S3Q3_9ACTN